MSAPAQASRVRLPSVTRILRAAGAYGDRPLPPQFYLDRGAAAHRSFELHDQGILDHSSVDPEIAPFLEAHLKAKRELSLKPLTPPVNEMYIEGWPLGYAGTIDNAAWVLGWRTVIDFKCGNGAEMPATIVQIAAYRTLLAYWLVMPLERFRGASLSYRTNGTYTYNQYSDDALDDAWHRFAAVLPVTRLGYGGE